ncbi:glycosyltransferase 87 family protein [Salinibacterium soli]|uniref:Glycosyltransferase 87 family protein n=1 Tax=Antiquaquibacter soli TaxID=3064523 RepID=A0ABT9BKB0_9MICO|nr:glycosyltransferase 87 family protein [Protaetiibacter sp. WY-16]MDO7881450.1 glycosyltransferase 87 family protein [Protaetiibacter sp. WY-16]
MTDAPTALSRPSSVLRLIAASPLTLWVAFVAAHLVLGLLALYAPGLPLGDVTLVYRFWIEEALGGGLWVGIDTAWVYPILALVPMLLATVFGPDQYGATWLSLVMVLNAVAFGFVTGWGRRPERIAAGWWWIAFLLLLGPIALARIDSVTVPIALVGVLLLASRPVLASALLAVATWIKVWPAALVLAALIAVRDRLRIVAGAAAVTAVVLIGALLLGATSSVLSFITEQTGRGLQVEAPVSTVWLWLAKAGVPGAFVYYDTGILTYQVEGPGSGFAAGLMTPLLAVAVFAISALAVVAVRRGAAVGDLLPPLSLGLVTALIAFNKVGSPQFVSWFAVPIVLGIVTSAAGWGRSFRVPAILVLVIAALTQVVYPYLYNWLLSLDLLLLVVLSARNLLYFALLAWAIRAIVASPHWAEEHPVGEDGLQTVWPIRLTDGSAQPQAAKG